MTTLVSPLYEYVQFNETKSDAPLKIYSRSLALDWACQLGNSDCILNAKNYYAAWMKTGDDERYIKM